MEIEIKNFRCFADSHPARLRVESGYTALIGPNNAGKSSLLRFFFELRGLFRSSLNTTYLYQSMTSGEVPFDVPVPPGEIFTDTNTRGMEIRVTIPPSRDTRLPEITSILFRLPREQNRYTAELRHSDEQRITGKIGFASDGTVYVEDLPAAEMSGLNSALATLADTLYIGPFRNALNLGRFDNYYDIQAGQAFVDSWREMKTGGNKTEARAAHEITEKIRQLFGFDQFQIDASSDGTTLHLLVNGRPLKLYETGSGLAQFIVVLANAARRPRALILIDEPELNLHPSLQVEFVNTLAEYASHGLIFGTHSLGLARELGSQTYSVTQQERGYSDVRSFDETPHLAELLGEVSYSMYREVGYDKILFVEGPSEMPTMRQFLRKVGKDRRVLPIPLGGSSLIGHQSEREIAELKRLGDDIEFVIDSERKASNDALPADRRAFKETCERLQLKCVVLERRSLENYFSDRAVKATLGQKYEALGPFEKLEEAKMSWAKGLNWKIAAAMNIDELDGTDLGALLAQL